VTPHYRAFLYRAFTCWLAYFDTVKAPLRFNSSQGPFLSFRFACVV